MARVNESAEASERGVAAVVPTRGAATLMRCLESLARDLADLGPASEIVVIDDAALRPVLVPPAIGGVPVRLEGHARRRGFGPTVNFGVASAKARWVAVVNDDVEIESGCLVTLAAALDRSGGFAACPAIAARERSRRHESAERTIDESLYRLGWHRATLRTQPVPIGRTLEPHYPSGALALYDRSRWLDLGGYDESFAPYYWEDVDLGLRARARAQRGEPGWGFVHVPAALARHSRHATVAAEPRWLRRAVYRRNRELLLMRHLASRSRRAWHWLALVPRSIRGLAGADPSHALGAAWALARRGATWRASGALDRLFDEATAE